MAPLQLSLGSYLTAIYCLSCINPAGTTLFSVHYLVPERKPGFFVKVKDGDNFNRRNTRCILRIKI